MLRRQQVEVLVQEDLAHKPQWIVGDCSNKSRDPGFNVNLKVARAFPILIIVSHSVYAARRCFLDSVVSESNHKDLRLLYQDSQRAVATFKLLPCLQCAGKSDFHRGNESRRELGHAST